MTPVHLKMLIGGAVIAGAVGYLGVTGVKSGWVYYLDVDQYVLQTEGGKAGQRARLHGIVSSEGADIRRADLTARFMIQGDSRQLPVRYRGAIPDMFEVGRQVVVEGAMDTQGVFQADLLLTKCASKYEGQSSAAPPAPTPITPVAQPDHNTGRGSTG